MPMTKEVISAKIREVFFIAMSVTDEYYIGSMVVCCMASLITILSLQTGSPLS